MTRRLFAVVIGVALAMSVTTLEAKPRHGKHYGKAHYSKHYKSHGVRKARHARYASRKTLRGYARHVGRPSTSRACLVPAARALLARIESQFGPVQVISTCRPGAVIAGSGRPSLHRYGMAFDFRTSNKAAVVRWLAANNPGGTMTYRSSNHIHADVGPHFVALGGGKSRRYGRRVADGGSRAYRVAAQRADVAAAQDGPGYEGQIGFRTYATEGPRRRYASRSRAVQ